MLLPSLGLSSFKMDCGKLIGASISSMSDRCATIICLLPLQTPTKTHLYLPPSFVAGESKLSDNKYLSLLITFQLKEEIKLITPLCVGFWADMIWVSLVPLRKLTYVRSISHTQTLQKIISERFWSEWEIRHGRWPYLSMWGHHQAPNCFIKKTANFATRL